jgi:hypothetical protein
MDNVQRRSGCGGEGPGSLGNHRGFVAEIDSHQQDAVASVASRLRVGHEYLPWLLVAFL